MLDSTGGSTILCHLSNCGLSLGTTKHKPITPSVSELLSKQDYKRHSCVTDFGDWKRFQSEVFRFPLLTRASLLGRSTTSIFSKRLTIWFFLQRKKKKKKIIITLILPTRRMGEHKQRSQSKRHLPTLNAPLTLVPSINTQRIKRH